MQVESHVLAQEIFDKKPSALVTLETLDGEGALGRRELLTHEQFKVLSRQARAIVRTGECQPYCNIVLVAGVTF
ncbi:D-ribose pyranase [compost metagenome]